MASEARRSALPDVEIMAATAQFGAQFWIGEDLGVATLNSAIFTISSGIVLWLATSLLVCAFN